MTLVHHKGYANATLMRAIRQHGAAAEDYELRRLFHHILIANRFWLMLRLGRDFLFEAEARVPETWEILAARSGNAHAGTEVARSSDGRPISHTVETQFHPGCFCLPQALMQICMHSHGHRCHSPEFKAACRR